MNIEIRCPNCNKKAAETKKKDSQVETICTRCAANFTYDNGKYQYKEPEDANLKRKYERFNAKRNMDRAAYQTRIGIRKK